MLANDASELAQQRQLEPARFLSKTHPRRNQAYARLYLQTRRL